MTDNEFECYECKEVFLNSWTEGEAREHYYNNFKVQMEDHKNIDLCENCYQLFMNQFN